MILDGQEAVRKLYYVESERSEPLVRNRYFVFRHMIDNIE